MKQRLLIAVMVIVGAAMWLYPGAAQWKQTVDTAAMMATTEALVADESSLAKLQAADDWNQRLLNGFDTSDYEEVLDFDDGLMARVQVPSINVDLPVYHGVSDATLRKGLGHLSGSSLPVGGESTHAVVSAHTGMASAVMLSDLPKVKVGDEVVVTVGGQVLSYEVISLNTVLPEEMDYLAIVPGKDLITLLTCTPLGINSHRLLVTAERTIPTTQSAFEASEKLPEPGFPWQFVVFGVVLVGSLTWALWPRRRASEVPATVQALPLSWKPLDSSQTLADTSQVPKHPER